MGREHLTVGVQHERVEGGIYGQRWAAALARAGVTVRQLDLYAAGALEQIRGCDAVLWRFLHDPRDKLLARATLHSAELLLGVTVFPDIRTSWHFDDKVAQHYALDALEAPRPNTRVLWDKGAAMRFLREANYPLVWKLRTGAGSANVTLLRSPREARDAAERVFRRGVLPYMWDGYDRPHGLRARTRKALRQLADGIAYGISGAYPALPGTFWEPEKGAMYLQDFVPGNTFDTRVTTIGDRAWAFRRLNRSGDFRASGSGALDFDPQSIDRRCIDLAFELSRRGQFQTMAYDFIADETGEPLVIEMSYGFVDWAVHACPGYWTPSGQWVPGQLWPQDMQVEDLLTSLNYHPRA